MFQVGDKVVHPMHGAGVIDSVVKKKVDGVVREYYILKIPLGGMMVLVPTDHCDEIGVRAVSQQEKIEDVLSSVSSLDVESDTNWNRRYRENLVRLKSGDLYEVARVIKALALRDGTRGLSTGERKMLHTARQILASEIVVVTDCTYDAAEARITGALAAEHM